MLSSRHARRLFIACIVLVLVSVSTLVGCGPKPSDQASPGTPATPTSTTPPETTAPLGLVTLPDGTAVMLAPSAYTAVPESAANADPGPASIVTPDAALVQETAAYGNVALNQVSVVLKSGKVRADAERVATGLNATIVGEIELLGLYQFQLKTATEEDLVEAIAKAAADDAVDVAFPNAAAALTVELSGKRCPVAPDPLYRQGDNNLPYEAIGLADAWQIIKMSSVPLHAVKAGVVDSMLNGNVSEFASGKVTVRGFTANDVANEPVLTHASAVTGVLGGDPGNGGVAGVAGVLGSQLTITVTNAIERKLDQPVLVTDPKDITQVTYPGGTYVDSALKAIVEQIRGGARVINCSFGQTKPGPEHALVSAAYAKALQRIAERYPKVVLVAAAGNANAALDGSNDLWGKKLPNLITVGGLVNSGQKAAWSNYAAGNGEVTISAPGSGILVGVGPTGRPEKWNGTSFAAPQVAGTVALLQAINPDLTAAQIKEILVKSAAPGITTGGTSVPIPDGMGAGVLRVDDAVLMAINGLRAKDQQLKKDQLLALAAINLVASGGPAEYRITATIPALAGKSANLRLELVGNGASFSGSSPQTLTGPGSATWTVTAGTEPVTARVIRLDTNACAFVELKGTPTIIAVEPSPVWYEEEVTITGTQFGTKTGAVTLFDSAGTAGAIVPVKSWSDNEIRLSLARGIIGSDPSKSPVGSMDVMVWVGGTSTSPTYGSLTTLSRPELRDGSWKGGIVGGTASNMATLAVRSKLAIAAVNPAKAQIGETVTLTGKGFGANRADSKVFFWPPGLNEAATWADVKVFVSEFTAWSDTEIRFRVPNHATAVSVGVQVGGDNRWAAFKVDNQGQLAKAASVKASLFGTWTFESTVKDAPKNSTEQSSMEVGFETAGAGVLWPPDQAGRFALKRQTTRQDGTVVTQAIGGRVDWRYSSIDVDVEVTETHPDQQRSFSYHLYGAKMTSATPAEIAFSLNGPRLASSISTRKPVKYQQVWTDRGSLTLTAADFTKPDYSAFVLTFRMP